MVQICMITEKYICYSVLWWMSCQRLIDSRECFCDFNPVYFSECGVESAKLGLKQHLCLLSPSFGPEYTVLQLVEEDVAGELKALHQFNSSYQNFWTSLITNQAVPGLFPLIFTGPKVAGRSASCLLARLRGLGNVGSQAYATLHEALKDVVRKSW